MGTESSTIAQPSVEDDEDYVVLPGDLAEPTETSQMNLADRHQIPRLPPLCLIPTNDGRFIVKPRTAPQPTFNTAENSPSTLVNLENASAPEILLPPTADDYEQDHDDVDITSLHEEEYEDDDDADVKESAEGENNASGGKKWRKYGCKRLKNARDHRNYFRCTQGSCPAKKIVEVRYNAQQPNETPSQIVTIRVSKSFHY